MQFLQNSKTVEMANFRAALLCPFFALLMGEPATAVEIADDVQVEAIKVVGTHLSRLELNAPMSRTTVDINDIKTLASIDPVDLLRGHPGVDSFRQGGPGSKNFLSIRGGDPNFTVIMVDGVRLNDPTDSRGGGFDLALMIPLSIDFIEIIKDASATAYGSDALSGVINIVTREPGDALEITARTGAGTNGEFEVLTNLSGPISTSVGGVLGVGYAESGTAIEGDRRRRLNFSGRLDFELGEIAKLHLNSFWSDQFATAFPEDSGGPRLAVLRDRDRRDDRIATIGADLAFDEFGIWQPTLSLLWSRITNNTDSRGIAPGAFQGVPASDTDTRFRQVEIIANNWLLLSEKLTIGFGGAFRSEDGKSRSILDFGLPFPADFNLRRKTISAFGEGRYQLTDRLKFGLGLRFDLPDSAPDQITSRASATYTNPTTGLDLEFSWGEGFKLPSFFALGHPLVGNSQLAPEEARNLELSVKTTPLNRRLELKISVFRNRYRNLIDFDPDLFSSVNRNSVRARGIEYGMTARPTERLVIDASATYQNVRVIGEKVGLRFRPKWKGRFRVAWQISGEFSLSVNGSTVGDYFDSSIPSGQVVQNGFSKLDATGQWQLNRHTSITFSISNLLDSTYEEAIGFPALPITGHVRLVAKL